MTQASSAVAVEVFLGLGSNLQQPEMQIRRAFAALQQLPESRGAVCSPFYLTPPMGPSDQPDYVNAVVYIETQLTAAALLQQIQAIERAQGRVRTHRWGARTIDIDLLLYGDQVIESPQLQVPHPGIRHRLFVLFPLLDLAPNITVPGQGRAAELALELQRRENGQIRRLD